VGPLWYRRDVHLERDTPTQASWWPTSIGDRNNLRGK
jgi:hypothetical protein